DGDVIAHGDVEEAGLVARAGDARDLVGAGSPLPRGGEEGRLRDDGKLHPPHQGPRRYDLDGHPPFITRTADAVQAVGWWLPFRVIRRTPGSDVGRRIADFR